MKSKNLKYATPSVLASLLVAGMLTACGGGGNSSPSAPTPAPAPSPSDSSSVSTLKGNYVANVGSGSGTTDIYLMVDAVGNARLTDVSCNQYVATLSAAGTTVNGSGTEYAPLVCNGAPRPNSLLQGGTVASVSADFEGGLSTTGAITFTNLTGTSGPTTFIKTLTSNRGVNLGQIAGFSYTSASLGMALHVDLSGNLSGSFQGNTITGSIFVPDPTINQFALSLTVGGVTYTGMASLEDGNSTSDTLRFEAGNGNNILAGTVTQSS